ncbi:SDR family oxidoreductase [Granulicella mallensis]|uniref:NAD(P)-dependent dehydrogenase (Short-subunit alcohol dehydrogenase family) n=1 Tax=Granulicella mallensis TaxID=940614 RepID=A0A7W7ZP36_9BACT|nr:SDR family oxidoreductase [Granulicella mallensis]MBB5063555.1 NAD(P)-dependent dehydrogenase (short-subunit alcohol dehydrogenase family) [Granulicella mallensis]
MPSEKKVALISGANRGIGFETARQLGQKGITVIVGARTQQAAKEAADKLVAENIEAYPVTLDVTKDEDRKAAARFVAEKFGTLDILINNAGVGGEGGLLNAHTVSTTDAELQTVFNTNLFSVVSVTREFLPLLKKSPAGRIVNLSSILGSLTLQAMPASPIAPMKSFAYNASKTALNQLTIHLADELKATNIKVNSAHPGWVKTELGTQHAQLEIVDGAKTTVDLALIGPDGPNGKFIHLGNELPW